MLRFLSNILERNDADPRREEPLVPDLRGIAASQNKHLRSSPAVDRLLEQQ